MIRDIVLGGLGLLFVAIGVAVAVAGPPAPSAGEATILGVVVLAATVLAIWKVYGSLDDPERTAVPWAETEPFASPPPEHAEGDRPLSGTALVAVIEAAAERAREAGTVENGLTVARDPLAETLNEALVAGGLSPDSARERIEDGTWTDDRLAASTLSASVSPPRLSRRRRIEAWLFPERVARRRIRTATNELAAAADEALPTVPGQTAPRNVPVVRPSLSELQRGADGRLQRAVDPMAVARGPLPNGAEIDAETGDEPK